MIAWSIVLVIFWKPIFWTVQAVVGLISRKPWSNPGNVNPSDVYPADHMARARAWFTKLWELVTPGLWS